MPRTTFAGHALHPQFVTGPLSLFPMALFFDFLYLTTRDKSQARAAFTTLAAGYANAVVAAAAVGLPYGLTFRYAFVPFLIGWLLIAWSRLASGHHYPSDILFGSLIGGAISLGVLVFIT
jgi:uncharacterized membrane protein